MHITIDQVQLLFDTGKTTFENNVQRDLITWWYLLDYRFKISQKMYTSIQTVKVKYVLTSHKLAKVLTLGFETAVQMKWLRSTTTLCTNGISVFPIDRSRSRIFDFELVNIPPFVTKTKGISLGSYLRSRLALNYKMYLIHFSTFRAKSIKIDTTATF